MLLLVKFEAFCLLFSCFEILSSWDKLLTPSLFAKIYRIEQIAKRYRGYISVLFSVSVMSFCNCVILVVNDTTCLLTLFKGCLGISLNRACYSISARGMLLPYLQKIDFPRVRARPVFLDFCLHLFT